MSVSIGASTMDSSCKTGPPVSSLLLCGSFAVGGGVTSSPPRPAPAVFSGTLSVMIPAETWSRLLLGNHH